MIIQAYLNNKPCVSPIELQDIGFALSFNQTVQPDIESKNFTFYGEDKLIIDDWIAQGRIFEGIPFKIQISFDGINLTPFDGILDLNELVILDPQRYEVPIKLIDGLNQLDTRVNGITFALLKDRDAINSSDYQLVDYVVEKESNFLELALLSLSIYIFTKQIADVAKDIADNGANASALTVAGVGGGAASTLWIAITLITRAAYYAILLIQLKELVTELFSFFFAPVRTHRGLNMQVAFQRIATYLGYGFETGIEELSKHVYLPSNQGEEDSIEEGIPAVGDYGYRCNEFFELAAQMFNTKVAVIDNVLHLRNVDDPFWDRLAELNITDTEEFENFEYNTDELIGAQILKFDTDTTDVWTVNNIDGTIYGVKQYNATIQNEKADLISGYNGINILACLGNRKDGLNAVESTLKTLGGIVDDLTDIFGGGTNFRAQIKARIGMLKVSTQYHSKPKILYMSGNRLDNNHRAKLSAENLFKTYHTDKLFTTSNFKNQKKVYTDKEIPFGLSDMAKLQTTNRAKLKGKTVEITKLVYQADRDTAIITVKEPYIYTRNLIEIESK